MFSTKQNVLKILEENQGATLSGASISKSLSVSRGAVWKAIESLRKEGHQIHATTNRGYCLSNNSDLLSADGILYHMQTPMVTRDRIHVFDSIDSTNHLAKKMALAGAPHGTVVLAEEQTQGRGRLGRSFYSPKGSGLYMSLLLRPQGTSSTAILTTTAAAVAVCRALASTLGIEAKIKWVNDIYLGGRKVCGILTEGITNFETGTIESLVLGIGINVFQSNEGFPDEIRDTAGTLKGGIEQNQPPLQPLPQNPAQHLSRNRLAAAVILETMSLCANLQPGSFLPEYKARSLVLDKEIKVFQGPEPYTAKAIGIDDQGGLIVQKPDGTIAVLNTGEITIRPLDLQQQKG